MMKFCTRADPEVGAGDRETPGKSQVVYISVVLNTRIPLE